MLFVPSHNSLWDTWLFEEDGLYHLFHLLRKKGSRSHAISHAVSENLLHWKEAGLALERGYEGEWDDGPLMTGTLFKKDGSYYLFYGAKRNSVQRIGVAISEDLYTWRKFPHHILEPQGQWYETSVMDNSISSVAWRDPCIFRTEEGEFHMFFCARSRTGNWAGRGAIGHATSRNLIEWSILPPVYVSDRYGFLETPDVFEMNGRWFLLFSCGQWHSTRTDDFEHAASGIRYLIGESLTGPFHEPSESSLLGSGDGMLGSYVGRTLPLKDEHESRLFYHHNVFPEKIANFKSFTGSFSSPKILKLRDDCLCLVKYDDFERKIFPNTSRLKREHLVVRYPESEAAGIQWLPGDLSIEALSSAGISGAWFDKTIEDGAIQVDIRLNRGNGGVLFGFKEYNNGFGIILNHRRQRVELQQVFRAEFGLSTSLIQYRPLKLSAFKEYRIELITVSPFIELYIDDVLVFSQPVEGKIAGRTGLLIEGGAGVFSYPNIFHK